jgi:hypothetical protein
MGHGRGSGSVRFDIQNGDFNKYSFQLSGSGNTFLKLQHNTATKDIFNNDGSLAVGQVAAAATGSILNPAGFVYIAPSTNPSSMNLIGFWGESRKQPLPLNPTLLLNLHSNTPNKRREMIVKIIVHDPQRRTPYSCRLCRAGDSVRRPTRVVWLTPSTRSPVPLV